MKTLYANSKISVVSESISRFKNVYKITDNVNLLSSRLQIRRSSKRDTSTMETLRTSLLSYGKISFQRHFLPINKLHFRKKYHEKSWFPYSRSHLTVPALIITLFCLFMWPKGRKQPKTAQTRYVRSFNISKFSFLIEQVFLKMLFLLVFFVFIKIRSQIVF